MQLKPSTISTLQKVRELFASTHWVQGDFQRKDGDKLVFCMVGGLRYVIGATANAGQGTDDWNGLLAHEEYKEAIYSLVESLAVTGQYEGSLLDEHYEVFDSLTDKYVRVDSYTALMDYDMPEVLDGLEEAVITWNDHDERVLSDILNGIDRAMGTTATA